MEQHPENEFKSIQQFCLGFLVKVNKKYSNPELIRKYNSSKDDFMNNSPVWYSILEELANCNNKDEYCAKIQYLIYHCIICLTDCKAGIWQKYFDMVKDMELVPIYPTQGHFKLMICLFQKLHDKLNENPNYFNSEQNRLYFTKNELICDFNVFQLHYLHTVFGLENFNLSNYNDMFPRTEGDYVWQYQSLKINTPEMKNKLNEIIYRHPINQQYQNDYFILALEKLFHKDYLLDIDNDLKMGYQQLRDLIYIIGTSKYSLDEKFNKFLEKLNDQQICLLGY